MKYYLIFHFVLFAIGFIGHMDDMTKPERTIKEQRRSAIGATLSVVLFAWALALLVATP